nr:PfaB family protein [Shewanella gelidii]
MLPALTAAKQKCHPHAVLVGCGETFASAVEHARRQSTDITAKINHSESSATEQFDALLQLIDSLHTRHFSLDADKASHYWFTRPHQARVASLELAQSTWVLTQGTASAPAISILNDKRLFFIIAADTQIEFSEQLEQLAASSITTQCIQTTMLESLLAYQANGDTKRYALVLQAAHRSGLATEISGMQKALVEIFDKEDSSYKTPAGSYFSATPLGQQALSFVYPGVGTVYPNMLNSLHQYFPALYARLEREGDFEETLQAKRIYPSAGIADEMSLGELAIAGVGASYVLTKILTQEFAIRPAYALGYSMGEAAMWASLDVWQAPHQLIEATQTSPIFTTAISGNLTAVREAWQVSVTEPIQWNSFVVRSPAQPILDLLPKFPRAYLPIIQGDTCVIAGCEQTCRDLLSKLGKRGIAANRVTAMHTPPAMGQHQAVLEFYHQPTKADVNHSASATRFISAAQNQMVQLPHTGKIDSDVIAKSIADTFCNRLDFTQLIQASREQGAKLFVEVGADRQTSTLIDKINKADGQSNACCTVPMNAKGGDDAMNLLKALAPLISHRVDMTLSPLLNGLQHQLATQSPAGTVSNQSNQTQLVEGEPQ